MASAPSFSVIIATYNRGTLLPKAIQSVRAQTFTDWELLIVDDGSTDTTEEVVKGYTDPRIRYLRLPENQGASAARNRGIEEARGAYLMVWDSDDELYDTALSTLFKAFADHPGAGIISAPAVPLRNGKQEPYAIREEGFVSLSQILDKYLPNNEKVRAVRRAVFLQVRYRSRNLDFMVNAYLAREALWYHLREPLGVLYLDGADSLTRGRTTRVKARSIERAEYLERYIEDFMPLLKEAAPKRLAAHAYGAALGFYLAGNPSAAVRLSALANANAPGTFRYVLLYTALRVPFLRPLISRFY